MGTTENAASPLQIEGQRVTLAAFADIATRGARVSVGEAVRLAMEENRRYLDRAAEGKIVYGVNTGFGPMAGHRIPPADQQALQLNLIRSHAVGQGDPLPDRFVRAAMLARLLSLSRGFSGIGPAAADSLADMLNAKIYPIIPERGSVGASGDLVQLAHIALGQIGEGSVRVGGKVKPAGAALGEAGIRALEIHGREGLALVNGTSAMAGIAACAAEDARRAVSASSLLSAWLYEVAGASEEYLAPELHAARPHPGQTETARAMREILAGSMRLKPAASRPDDGAAIRDYRDVQHGYSIRCAPQVIGPVRDAVSRAEETFETELNSSTDNPITATNVGIFHGGNFHGDYVAAAADSLKAALAKLGMLAERQIAFLFNPDENRSLPPFLNLGRPGVDLGLQGLQFVATSTAAMGQTLAFPASLHSIPTNNGNQDIVSMGADAAIIAAKVADGTLKILAIEAFALARATRILGIYGAMSPRTRAAHDAVAQSAQLDADRFSPETVAAVEQIVRGDPAFS